MIDRGGAAIVRSPLPGYAIKRVYLISCEKCNEDITRTGEDVEYAAEARAAVRDHEHAFHQVRS